MNTFQGSSPATQAPVQRDRLLRLPEVERISGIRKSTVYGLMAQGKFPRCVQVTPRCVAWAESSVHKWVQDRIADAGDTAALRTAAMAAPPRAKRGAGVEAVEGNAHG